MGVVILALIARLTYVRKRMRAQRDKKALDAVQGDEARILAPSPSGHEGGTGDPEATPPRYSTVIEPPPPPTGSPPARKEQPARAVDVGPQTPGSPQSMEMAQVPAALSGDKRMITGLEVIGR